MSKMSMSFAAAVALCIAAGCSGRGSSTRATATPVPTEAPASPLSMEARLFTSLGLVEAKLGAAEGWRRVDSGAPITKVRQLRALGSGALIELGGVAGRPSARLWMRAASVVSLSQDGDGALFVDVRSGEARLESGELAGYVQTDGALVRVTGRDVLVGRDAGDRVSLAFTAGAPDRAGWSLAIEAEGLDDGFGRLEANAAGGRADLELRRVAVSVETDAGFALTAVEHVFHNASSEVLEGTFRFPVPAGAMVESLAMEINGRLMEGEIVEKEKARQTYESIVDNMLDPALLEWEQGNWFKLRVFPIEPNADKRVIIRYASPLETGLAGHEYRYTAATAAMQKAIDKFTLTVDGQTVVDVDGLDARREIAVPIAGARIPAVAREIRGEHVYTAVRVRPDWSAIAAPEAGGAQKIMILFDTSRSAMEGRALALATLESVLGELGGGARFALATVDVEAIPVTEGFVAANAEAIASAMSAVKAVEMDGASDLASAIELAAAARPTSVIYIGDGTATWGQTDGQVLERLATDKLGGAPLFAALVGKGASVDLWSAIAGRLGGRVEVTTTPLAAKRFAFFAARAPAIKRIAGLTVAPIDGAVIYPQRPTALYDGDELVVLMRQKVGAVAPAIELRGTAAGAPVSWRVELAGATAASRVAQRWAARHLPAREAAGADKAEIVALSRDHGILSRHTSLLVLESEEAYREHQIERKRGPEAVADNRVQVTGGDLESLEARQASLSPDHIQPGDPEIKVPAPADARRVVVIFPFGDTKIATYDDELEAWIARFLIDKDTADGDYAVDVVITHADGRVERQKLSYTVDTVAPEVDVSVVDQGDGTYAVEARQRRPRGHRFGRDAHRVEVEMPDGQIINLTQTAWGRFAREWKPAAPVTGSIDLVVTATDRALNQSVRRRAVAIRSR
jgi:hypothetical protein